MTTADAGGAARRRRRRRDHRRRRQRHRRRARRALRGLKVALFERNDLAFGASGNSSGMIHGGARYLTHDPQRHRDLVPRLGAHPGDRAAPALPHPVPDADRARRRAGASRSTLVDAFFEAYDSYQPLKRGKPHARLTPDELARARAGPRGGDAARAASRFDEWGIDGARLCVANAVDAIERGAERLARTPRSSAIQRARTSGAVRGVRCARSARPARARRSRARAVVNATGAWAPITASLRELAAEQRARAPRQGHPRRLRSAAHELRHRRARPSTAGRSSSSRGRT